MAIEWALLITTNALLLIATAILCVSNAKLWVELKAMKQSTHTLTYMNPLDAKEQSFETITDDLKKKLKDDPLGAIDS